MKLGELTHRTGETVWPGRWVESLGPGDDASAIPGDGILEGLTRLGGRLLLRINVNGQGRTASLEWEPPPAVGDVERVLLASMGAEIRQLGLLDLPSRGERARPTP
jgi:hypothetical protein